MKKSEFRNIIREEIRSVLNEEDTIIEIDHMLEKNDTVCAHKLCGAGNGGFFLVFSNSNSLKIPYESVKIEVSPNGVMGRCL